MAMVKLNEISDADIQNTLSLKNGSNLCGASFSSYLNDDEETFVRQLAESSPNFKSHFSSSHKHLQLLSKKAEDNEIDVFNADKYFNGFDEDNPRIALKCSPELYQKQDTHVQLYPAKQQTQSGTPSICSESSSNSQSALLHNIPRHQHHRKKNKVHRKSFLANFGCNCSCIDKNSVDIDDNTGQTSSKRSSSWLLQGKARNPTKTGDLVSSNKSCSNPWIREDTHSRKFNDRRLMLSTEGNFTFQASDSKAGNEFLEGHQKLEEDVTRRKSLEAFGSPIHRRGKKSLSFERGLNMFTWEIIIPRVENIEIPASSSRIYNDTDSDASSDLFEIESFSTNPNQNLTRQASDGMSSGITQTTCYDPSEASIEWGVVAASAADFSMMTDFEELRTTAEKPEPLDVALNGKNTAGREIPKNPTSILSGCNIHKGVRVVGDDHKTSEKASPARHQRSDFLMPMTRFHAENELARLDNRSGHLGSDQRLLTCSQTGGATQLSHEH